MSKEHSVSNVHEAVRSAYGSTARRGLSSRDAGVAAIATAFGYSPDDLAAIPAEANMGLSCGNPLATAGLRPGEVVVDLGCGGGLDVFLAAQRVGPTGRAIGIDMTPEMLDLARRNAQKQGATNVEFHHATIDRLPLPSASVDCVISNCVINLAPDKAAVFAEIRRVLRPGGRLAVSDIALKQPLPPALAASVAAYTGCIAGALPIDTYEQMLGDAGFAPVEIVDTQADLNVYGKLSGAAACCSPPAGAAEKATASGCCTPLTTNAASSAAACCEESAAKPAGDASPCCAPAAAAPATGCCAAPPALDPATELAPLLEQYDVNEYAASVRVFALRP